jgi:hypothetical protein
VAASAVAVLVAAAVVVLVVAASAVAVLVVAASAEAEFVAAASAEAELVVQPSWNVQRTSVRPTHQSMYSYNPRKGFRANSLDTGCNLETPTSCTFAVVRCM